VSGTVEVVLYGAPDCSLCDTAMLVLEPAAARLGFQLRKVDVSGDPELERRYRESIPVVEIDGARAFVYHVSPTLLERRIADAQARRSSMPS
jgi:thiol-disulfide isomerase/thioredoxin